MHRVTQNLVGGFSYINTRKRRLRNAFLASIFLRKNFWNAILAHSIKKYHCSLSFSIVSCMWYIRCLNILLSVSSTPHIVCKLYSLTSSLRTKNHIEVWFELSCDICSELTTLLCSVNLRIAE